MKKSICSKFFSFILVSSLVVSVPAAQATIMLPMYVGIGKLSSGLSISTSGEATCSGMVVLRSGYTVDLDVELKRDGVTIQTWSSSGSGIVSAGDSHYVTSGHEYVVTTTALVYDINGNVVENPSKDSITKSY